MVYCIFRITNEKLNKAEFLFNETYNTEEVDKILSLLNEGPDTFVAVPAYCIRDDALRIGKNDQILLIIKVANEKPVEILAADESNTSTIVDLLNQENGDENTSYRWTKKFVIPSNQFFPRSYSYYNRNKRFELIKLLENQELLNECGIYFCTGIYFFKLAHIDGCVYTVN